MGRSLLVLPLLGVLASRPAAAQTVRSDLPVPNGPVYVTAVSGNPLYGGGSFTSLGPASGGGVPFDAVTGSQLPVIPRVAGTVRTAVPDGRGGWYIGGLFSAIGGVPRLNCARIRGDGTVTQWNPQPNGQVNTIAVAETTVYLSGFFSSVANQTRYSMAAADTGAGLLRSWIPIPNINPQAMAYANGVVYVGGPFTNMSGQTRMGIAALDPIIGLVTNWNPNITGGAVNALVVKGGTVVAGGTFNNVGGLTRNRIAAIDTATGVATAWDPNIGGNRVPVIAISGSTVY